ncbi:MAG: hypothetical protein GY861_10035 [bacterium]|nr:hypothetical protein [bacterium]
MQVTFNKGFTVYRNHKNIYEPVFVAPHCGPAFEVPTSRDENSDTVSSLCWMKSGGSLIVSGVPRKRLTGIDFNRDPPPKKLAIQLWQKFYDDENGEELEEFRRRYGWVAKDEKDYDERLRVYTNFWDTVKRMGNIIVFVHRKFARMKNFPSLLDVITYEGKGVDKKIMESVLKNINSKYEPFFKKVERSYKDAVILEEERIVERIRNVFTDFNMKSMKVEYRKNIKKDIDVIKKYADKRFSKRLDNNFNQKNFILALKSALKKPNPPLVTTESIFKGERAMSVKAPFFTRKEKLVMEVECNQFISYWYPAVTADIIVDLLNNLRAVDMYKRLGMKQTNIAEFLKSK